MMSTDAEAQLLDSNSSHQDPEETENRRRIKLYRAALRGDCKYEIHPEDKTAKISERGDTALHIGAMGKSCNFAIKLLHKLDRLEDLFVINNSDNTAFCLAVASGKLELAKEMIQVAEKMKEDENCDAMIKNEYRNLAQVKGNKGVSPLLFAVIFRREEMVYWLYYLTKGSLNGDDRIKLLLALIKNGFHELALQLLEEDKELATACYEPKETEETEDETDETKETEDETEETEETEDETEEKEDEIEETEEKEDEIEETEGETKEKKLKKETALHALAQLPIQQGVCKRIKRCFKRCQFSPICKLEKKEKKLEKETALHALAQLPIQQGVCKRIKRCFKRYNTLQLLEKYNETIPNQQGLWEKIKKCFNRFLCSIEKQSPEMKLLHRVWELALSRHDFDQNSDILKVAQEQIFVAARRGNVEFLEILIREYPDLIFHKDNNEYNIFHFAVKHRHEDIVRLIHEIGSFKDFTVPKQNKKGNSILHLAAKLAPLERLHSVSGVALQMQRELLWFEEVKKLMNPLVAEVENNQDGKSPRDIFSKKHKNLKKDGEKWMKDTANYCMVVAALITAMVFAAILAVPGGTSDETGTPHFLTKSSFKIFVVSDAISLVLSTCSIFTFLSILTSRYAEEDFLKPLPTKLLVGLGTLVLSIAAMMVAFCAAIFILFKDGVVWIPILVAAISSLSVISSIQQVYLFIVVLCSTYISSSIFKPGKGTLFFENVREGK